MNCHLHTNSTKLTLTRRLRRHSNNIVSRVLCWCFVLRRHQQPVRINPGNHEFTDGSITERRRRVMKSGWPLNGRRPRIRGLKHVYCQIWRAMLKDRPTIEFYKRRTWKYIHFWIINQRLNIYLFRSSHFKYKHSGWSLYALGERFIIPLKNLT